MERPPSHKETRTFAYPRIPGPRQSPDLLFATPLLNRRLAIATPDFLARVKAYVLDLETRDKGLKRSNAGGWHSSGHLFDTADETMRQLADALLAVVAEMSHSCASHIRSDCTIETGFGGSSWANVSRDGDFNKPHIHPGFDWSGVFYVDLGERDPERDESANIEFMDPRPAHHQAVPYWLRPSAGKVLVFPSWLRHYVNPFRGRGERISIAFNANARISVPDGA